MDMTVSVVNSITLIFTSINSWFVILQDYLFHRNINEDLKAFVDKYGFDVLVISASYLSEGQEKKQIAVYSENMELGNQVCILEKRMK